MAEPLKSGGPSGGSKKKRPGDPQKAPAKRVKAKEGADQGNSSLHPVSEELQRLSNAMNRSVPVAQLRPMYNHIQDVDSDSATLRDIFVRYAPPENPEKEFTTSKDGGLEGKRRVLLRYVDLHRDCEDDILELDRLKGELHAGNNELIRGILSKHIVRASANIRSNAKKNNLIITYITQKLQVLSEDQGIEADTLAKELQEVKDILIFASKTSPRKVKEDMRKCTTLQELLDHIKKRSPRQKRPLKSELTELALFVKDGSCADRLRQLLYNNATDRNGVLYTQIEEYESQFQELSSIAIKLDDAGNRDIAASLMTFLASILSGIRYYVKTTGKGNAIAEKEKEKSLEVEQAAKDTWNEEYNSILHLNDRIDSHISIFHMLSDPSEMLKHWTETLKLVGRHKMLCEEFQKDFPERAKELGDLVKPMPNW